MEVFVTRIVQSLAASRQGPDFGRRWLLAAGGLVLKWLSIYPVSVTRGIRAGGFQNEARVRGLDSQLGSGRTQSQTFPLELRYSEGLMRLELVNTLATFGTFLVIAATAIAAVVQLRHARGSNHIAALNELRETTESPDS